jgi:hypothetical protein
VLGYDLRSLFDSDWPDDASGQWTAIGAIGTLGLLVASLFAFVAVVFAYGTLRTGELEHRLHTLPYFKAFVGFECLRSAGFDPPAPKVSLGLSDVAVEQEAAELLQDLHSAGEGAHPLAVWLQNLQGAPLGVGFDVAVDLGMRWKLAGKNEVRDRGFVLGYHHVEAAQTVKIHLASIGDDVDYVDVTVLGIGYRDLNGRTFQGGHGPTVFRYDRDPIGVSNEPINF